MKIGYARVSTREQNLDLQVAALKEAGCEKIFAEKISGTLDKRPELDRCFDILRPGDMFVVYKLDRLGRSLKNILFLLDKLKKIKVSFFSICDNLSTEGVTGQLVTNILGSFAQFERDIIVARCQEGRRAALEKGVKFGRPKGVNKKNEDKVKSCANLYKSGYSVSDIKKFLQISSYETIYRYLEKEGIKPNRKK